MFFSSTAAAAQQREPLNAGPSRRRRVAVFGPNTPGQTRTPHEENGARERDFFSGSSAYYALWIVLRIADRGTEEAAAQQQWWQRRRGYGRKGRAWMRR